ncbi:MAG TPA: electron transfer flavoprotein subunit alpha/FixB family protein, partial [Bacteroidota bacterium]|nr:electron transfer flavoprotein subunit alpha/FixB family protein [Bacteroidota bacterium]
MKILVVAEQRDNKFKKPAFEAVRAARNAADQTGSEVIALVIGGAVESIAPSLGGYGANKVLVAQDARLASYAPRAYAKLIASAAR